MKKLMTAALFALSATSAHAIETVNPKLEIVITYTPKQMSIYGKHEVVGVATNRSGKEISAALISFNLLDREGALIGNAIASVNNLAPGQKWKFSAPVLVDGAVDEVRVGNINVR